MRCQDLMRRPVETCHDYESVQVAARLMAEADIGFLPVCDEDERLVGVITDRDIAVRLVADDRTASDTRVGDIMTHEIVACRPGDEVDHAQALMARHKKMRVVVVENGVLQGIVSFHDIVKP
jgi:CBS domain-containing protein